MSEYFDHYHRWEPLAEFHFNLDSENDDEEENYVYCLCSRAFIRDGVKFYHVDKEASDSDAEAPKDTQSQPGEDQSHVHFSIDTSYKVKCEKDEGASCYCSASHTDNCCSTDEHDMHSFGKSHLLQPSDSGTDLTYQDNHLDYINHDKHEQNNQELPPVKENYLSEDTFDKFWAINGERLIWASWIKKYSDYINPSYLEENSDLLTDDSKLPKQRSVDQIFSESDKGEDDSLRERKFSYDSKVNPYKKAPFTNQAEKHAKIEKDESWLPINRRRSCSEHERIVSPRTIAGTDSMTNVTKITMSSYDITSSHVTSESSPDDFSVSSSTSDDQSNDQTRIANLNLDPDNTEEMDTDQYWQFLWKKHFGDQYALHYANYNEMFNKQNFPDLSVEMITNEKDLKEMKQITNEKVPNIENLLEIECENSEENSQNLCTVIEVPKLVAEVEQIKIKEGAPLSKNRKKGRKTTYRHLGSVGVLLQNLLKNEQDKQTDITEEKEAGDSDNLLKEEQENEAKITEIKQSGDSNKLLKEQQEKEGELTEVKEAGDSNNEKKEREEPATEKTPENVNTQPVGNNNLTLYSNNDGDDDPPEETPVNLKRSHELEADANVAEKIKNTFEIMGFSVQGNTFPKGSMVYRKKIPKLRPPRYRKFATPKKTYFDEDGNPVQELENEFQEERAMQSEDDCPDFRTEAIKLLNSLETSDQTDESKEDTLITSRQPEELQKNESLDDSMSYDVQNKVEGTDIEDKSLVEASEVPLPSEAESNSDETKVKMDSVESVATTNTETAKRRRRQKRQAKIQESIIASMPEELRSDPRMLKYWKKRHSLFHRFDEGIRLDRESWFSVTPENVARHIACKYTYDTVLDAFCGAGGNTIQFAFASKKVIAVDIDPAKIELARHNAAVYGVADRIEFIVGDFFELASSLHADMVFLSPPWGGPEYSQNAQYDIETMLQPKPASELMVAARTISPTVYLYLPRHSRPDQILSLAKEVGGSVEVEQSFLDRRFVAITAYFY